MTDFAALQTNMTADETRDFLRDLVITSPAQIPAEVLDTPTTPEAAIIYALGEAEAIAAQDRVKFAKSATRSTATDPFLRIIAAEQFSLTPRSLTFATTTATYSNASDLNYGPFDPGQFIVRNSVSKALYANVDEIASIPPGVVDVAFDIIALVAGTDSDALPGEITELETPLQGVTVTNPSAALATDEESGASINGRIDAKIGALGNAGARGWNTGTTTSSFESVAKNGPDDAGGCVRTDGSLIEVTRTQTVSDPDAGTVTLYLADDDGPIATDDVTIVREQVQLYTEWNTLEVDVENSTLVTVTYDGTLTISSRGVSATNAEILAAIDASLTAAGRVLEVGEGPTLDYGRDAILDVGNAGNATAFRIKSLVLSAPIADTTLADGEVANLVRGTITIVRS